MDARITIAADRDLAGIAAAAGAAPGTAWYDPVEGELVVPGVEQAALDAAAAGYDHLAHLRARALAALAERRWRAETGGVDVGGVAVRTDRESQGLIAGAVQLAQLQPGETTRFKAASGWVELTAAQVQAVGVAVAGHVRSCFAREAELSAEIEAAADEASLAAIDLDAGWPATAAGQG